jgi:RHS repeat-associated protein
MISRSKVLTGGLIAYCCVTNAFASYGRTAGQFAVSPEGSAQYSIPIWTPPGVRGIQPQLTLAYDSQLGYGLMGPGWTLSGLSAISRCNPTYAQDSFPAPITLTISDGLCLDGNRLVTTGTATYQTEIANFSQVTASGTAGNGPSYFTVQGKDGLTYEYGNTTDSKILPAAGVPTPYIWALDKVTDRLGNHMTFTYYQSGGAYVPLSVQYTAPSGSSTFPYQVSFTYTTLVSPDPNILNRSVAGSQIQQTQQLSTITVTNAGTTVRKYKLLYTTSSTTLRATLTSIQQCGGSGGTDCLAANLTATSVGYQAGTAGVANPAIASGSGATNGIVYSVDIDGDGKQDLIFATTSGSNYIWWVQFATATGYRAPINTGAVTVGTTDFLIDDFLATGQNEILAPVGGVWYAYQWNGTGFAAAYTGVGVIAGAYYSSADVNGDGRPDLVSLSSSGAEGSCSLSFQLNTSSAAISFVSTPVTQSLLASNPKCGLSGSRLYGNNQLPNSPVKHFDFDGDGRQDLLLYYQAPFFKGSITGVVAEVLTRGTDAPLSNEGLGNTTNLPQSFMAVNWNDDGCTDLIFGFQLLVSQCNGSSTAYANLPTAPLLAVDWDGDGRTDALANVGGVWELYRSEGNTFAPGVSTGISVGTGTWAVTDQNADGLHDLVFANSAAGNALYYGLHNGADTHPDLARSFTDEYGYTIQPSYKSPSFLGQCSLSTYLPTFPDMNTCEPLQVVSQAVFSDPSNAPSGTYLMQYTFTNAVINRQGRGFEGYSSFYVSDGRDGRFTSNYYVNFFPYTGMLASQFVEGGPGANYNNIFERQAGSTFLTLDATPNHRRDFPYFDGITDYLYDVTSTSNPPPITINGTTYTYDTFGNATHISTTVTDNDTTSPYYNDTWTSTTVNSFTPNTSTWCRNLPTETTVTNSSTAPNGAAITRTVAYNNPDYTYCRETEKVIEPSSGTYKVIEDYGYDSFGNLHTDTVTGVGMTPRVTTITWTANGQFPLKVQNPLLQSVTLGFDPNNGMKISQTDLNSTTANPLAASWTYDNFARELSETRLDGTSTTTTYNACATSGCVNANNKMTVTKTVHNVGGSTQTIQNIYLDEVDRPLVTNSLMLNGAYDRNEVQYDNLGNVHLQGAPCTFVGCTTYWTTNTYDVLHRLTESQRPISATNSTLQTTTITYSGRTTTIKDALSNSTTKINLVTGNLARSVDAAGYYQNFSYDAFGSLLTVVDSHANPLFTATYDYGIEAFQRNATDMDLDKSTAVGQHRLYTYDALGEVTSWTDAKGQNFSVTYDALSRPLVRTEPDLTTTWNWGGNNARYDIGKLNYVTAVGSVGTYTETFGYDSKTRLATDSLSLPGDSTYTYTFAYNATTGLLDTLQYPVSTSAYQLKLQYGYANGMLQKISDFNNVATVFWTANTTNPRGQVTQETLGNGVVTTRVFDAVTGLTSSINAGVGGGTGLLNSSYLFDQMGNVIQRQNNSPPGLTENFFYDVDYRLDHSTLNNAINLQMHYDATGMGNIASRSDLGGGAAWIYDPVRKHAVTQAGSTSNTYTYDNNGNAITRNGNAITWSSYNYPTAINATGESVDFWYGPNRERWKTVYNASTGTETTYIAGKLLEKVVNGSTTDFRHYIFAGTEPVAIYSRTLAGVNTLRYTLEDHEGSFAGIVSSTGTPVVNESFSAFGNRRNATTWVGPPAPADETTINGISREGYTGQTVLGVSMGLNHMNGRVQDAITGRFLSPDPFVVDPGNTQGFNRYSYADNNPLSLIDPSGFDDAPLCDNCGVLEVVCCSANDSVLGIIGSWFGLGGGGGRKLDANQRAGVAHEIDIWSEIQGSPHNAVHFAISATAGLHGPQIVGNPSPYAYDPFSIGSNLGDLSGPPPAPTVEEFAAQTAADIQSDQALRNQSSNFNFDSPSYWSLVGQSMARSGPKALNTGLVVANFLPFVGIAADFADAALVARAVAPSSRALGRALETSGIARPAGSAAHHIVAGSAQGAAAARATLQRLGIGINDAANGVFLSGAEHAGVHTAEYYAAVNQALSGATTRAEAEQILQRIAGGLGNGTFP